MATVMSCSCSNVHQDQIHGTGRRVFNRTGKKDIKEYRCTSCCAIKTSGGSSFAKKKGK